MAKWFPVWFNQQFFLKSGKPASNGWVEVFLHGTTSHAPTYNQNDQENANPIPLDNYGRCQLKISDAISYDFYVYDENMAQDDFIENVKIPNISGGETGTTDHRELEFKDSDNQHPTSAITNLDASLADKVSKSTTNDQTIKSSLIVDGNSSDSANVKIYGNFYTGASRVDVTGASGQVQVVASATGDPWVKVKNETSGSVAYVHPEGVSVSNYSGAAYSRVDINGLTMYGQSKITFDTTPDLATLNEGVIQWDATDSTLAVGMGNGVVQQVGAELPHKAKNVSGTDFVDGQIGYIFGASGQRISMKKPTASDITAIKALFMATQTVSNNNTGFFNALGVVHGVDTHLFAEGAEVWLDTTAGAITATAPAKPNYQARMGYVVVSHATTGSIFFHPDIQPKLGDLSNADTTGMTQGDSLTLGSDNVFKKNLFWDDWRWAGLSRTIGGNAPTLTAINGTTLFGYVFTNGKELYYNELQLPHEYAEGTDIHPHIHFAPTTTATYTGTWTLEYIDYLDVNNGTDLQAKKTVTADFNYSATAYQIYSMEFSSVIAGLNRKISSILFAKLTLTLTAGTSILLCGIDAHYQKDRLGSNSIYSK